MSAKRSFTGCESLFSAIRCRVQGHRVTGLTPTGEAWCSRCQKPLRWVPTGGFTGDRWNGKFVVRDA